MKVRLIKTGKVYDVSQAVWDTIVRNKKDSLFQVIEQDPKIQVIKTLRKRARKEDGD